MRLALALVHYPVLDRSGGTVTTAITNLDLHDMARSARTYGAERLFVVHPVAAQRALAERIREHWVSGSGKRRIPDRAVALDVLSVVPRIEDAYAALSGSGRAGVEVWTTAAASRGLPVTSYAAARARLSQASRPVLIQFGTGWGLAPELIADADVRIEPIRAATATGYNHLSVRAACAITLDRLLGDGRAG
ncbi:RNA methyltransferase [Sorangium sp. So ce1036]|uniref:RNA methyltransferase n=1 Tax=Sorangium sp. So ce1036 TaxID=3133328 RepID=UPI003F01500F